MIEPTPAYLRSKRTLTAAQVAVRTQEHDKDDVPARVQYEANSHHAEYEAARH